jgi:hypothetical protein
MVKLRGTMGSEIPKGFGTSASASEVTKRIAEDDVAPREEAQRAQVEENLGAPQMPSPMGWREDESG